MRSAQGTVCSLLEPLSHAGNVKEVRARQLSEELPGAEGLQAYGAVLLLGLIEPPPWQVADLCFAQPGTSEHCSHLQNPARALEKAVLVCSQPAPLQAFVLRCEATEEASDG